MMSALRPKALMLKLLDDEASVVTDHYIMQRFGRFAVVAGLILALGACAETELAVHTAKQITTAVLAPAPLLIKPVQVTMAPIPKHRWWS